jgi:uncharacterized RDD family membrane protein YckC
MLCRLLVEVRSVLSRRARQGGANISTRWPTVHGTGEEPRMTYAPWNKRVGAFVIDMLVMQVFLLVGFFAGKAIGGGAAAGAALGLSVFFYSAGMVTGFYNKCIRMGKTGQSWGKKALGIRLVFERSHEPIGVGMAVVRECCHVADMLTLGVGYLLPLWDAKRQTLGDKIVKTIVVPAIPAASPAPAAGLPAAVGADSNSASALP